MKIPVSKETSASIAWWQFETFGPEVATLNRLDRTSDALSTAMAKAEDVLFDERLLSPRPCRPNLSRALRAAQQLAGLITLLANDDNASMAPEEVASVDIALRGIDGHHGVERADQVDAKMRKLRNNQ